MIAVTIKRMSLQPRAAFGYAAAVLMPLILGGCWDSLSPALQVFPALLFLLFVSLFARFCGFGAALTFIAGSAAVLALHVFPRVNDEAPLALRLGLYLAISVVIASISRQRSEEVRAIEERYRTLVELSPDGVGVADETATIVFANRALARMLGASDPAQIVGKKTLDFAHPDDLSKTKERIAQLRAGEQTVFGEAKWVRLDGRTIDVETAGVPVRLSGKGFFQGFVRDVTERKEAAAKLEENRRRLQALFDSALDAILFLDSAGHVTDSNPRATALFGWSREEITRKSVADFTSRQHRATAIRAFRQALAEGESSGELSIVRADGASKDVEFRVIVNFVPGQHVVMLHDITARKDAERGLRQLSGRLLRLQDDERRRISRQLHDTTAQNLAAVRLNLASISRSAAVRGAEVEELLHESIVLTEAAITEIRTLSYLLHPPLIDEAGLATSLQWFARGFETRSGIEVDLDMPETIERLSREAETALFRFVQEALTNVQRHSGSRVAHIRFTSDAHEVRLEVRDEGSGIPELRGSNKEALIASGLGLAGVRERAHDLGGRMEIDSTSSGTTISVVLPKEK
jgi:PAS domain S-box-containing protein